ncbi:MAG TPA: hypothetical protein VMT51_12480, partial [Dongiaceae bacterium]|nr:hypothetical protein [Dongiaceae bacterium]
MFVQTRSSISAGVAQGAAKLPFNWRSLTRGLRQRRVKRAAVLTALCAFAALLGLAILAGVREHRVSRLQSYL